MPKISTRRLRHQWEKLHTSYYFVPALMLLGAALVAMALTSIDQRASGRISDSPWVYAGTPDGARVLLASVAGSVITVAGVVFSITVATLTQASNQFGPRLLRNFMRDTGNQVVLGTFVATYVYCILVLRAVGRLEPNHVPHLSVTGAVVLSILCIYLLVYFIHHTSFSLQAPQVAAMVWRDLQQAINEIFPVTLGQDGPPPQDVSRPLSESFYREATVIHSPRTGYLQAIDEAELLDALVRNGLRCELGVRPGDFIILHSPLLQIGPAERLTPALIGSLQRLFMIGHHRTAEQDLEFSIHQLSEIAVRALSPGINDPYTAMTCIDWLGDALCRIAANDLHVPYRYDEQGELRIVARIITFPGVVASSVDHIRQYGRNSEAVTIRLLEMIGDVALQLKHEAHRAPMRRQVEMIGRQAQSALPEQEDREAVALRCRIALERLSP